ARSVFDPGGHAPRITALPGAVSGGAGVFLPEGVALLIVATNDPGAVEESQLAFGVAMNPNPGLREVGPPRAGGYLQDEALEAHCVVVAYHALFLVAEDVAQFDPDNRHEG